MEKLHQFHMTDAPHIADLKIFYVDTIHGLIDVLGSSAMQKLDTSERLLLFLD